MTFSPDSITTSSPAFEVSDTGHSKFTVIVLCAKTTVENTDKTKICNNLRDLILSCFYINEHKLD